MTTPRRSGRHAGSPGSGDHRATSSEVPLDTGDHQENTSGPMLALMQGMLQSQMEQTALVRQALERQQPPPVADGPQIDRPGTLDSFYRLRPTPFTGDETALEAEDWIIAIHGSLRAARITEVDRVPIVVRLLRGNARAWWLAQTGGTEESDMTWDQFRERFLAYFFPRSQKADMQERFASLQQGDRSVDQYAAEFARLSRFSPGTIASEEDKVMKFRRGLRDDLRTLLPHSIVSYEQILHEARMLERDPPRFGPFQNLGKRTADQSSDRGTSSQQGKVKVQVTSPRQQPVPVCHFCGKTGHMQRDCRARLHLCLVCGGSGHSAASCASRRPPVGVGGAPSRPSFQQPAVPRPAVQSGAVPRPGFQFAPRPFSQQQSVQRPVGSGVPRPPLPPQKAMFAQHGRQVGRRTGAGRGQAYQLVEEAELEVEAEAETAGDVVAGMILVHSFPARVLFDSGATHSFLSSAFVAMHAIPSTSLSKKWVINTGNGTIQISHESRGSPVQLCGREFIAHFLIFGSATYDAILGMDWLSTFHAIIDCQ